MYKSKAKFNNESFDILDMFIKQRNFKVICFALDKNERSRFAMEWQGITHMIMQRIGLEEEHRKDERA